MPAMRLAVLALAACIALQQVAAEIKLQSVERKINLNSILARVTETIKVKNTGSSPVDRVVLCQAKHAAGVIAYQKVTQVLAKNVQLVVAPATPDDVPAQAVCITALLSSSIPAGESGTVKATTIWADVQIPFPAEVSQGDPHLVLFQDTVYVLSPYTVSTQTTEVQLPSSTVKSYTDSVKPVGKSGETLRFGKYDLVSPWTVEPMRLHYEHNKPFKKASSLLKEVELSHWGNIYVEEQYEVVNAGAKHKGAFSRLRYAHSYNGKGNSYRDLRAHLPAAAHSMYYVDIIGNISTSVVRKSTAETVVDFDVRYPLMGGWKVDFKLGYSLPLSGFLFRKKSDGKRRLRMDLGTSLEDLYVEDLTVRVVLPEGASGIVAHVPEGVTESRDIKYTYLDTTGRPVVVLKVSHMVPEEAAQMSIDYSFSPAGVAREPLLLIAAFAALFLAAIMYNRMEFTISKDEKWQAGQKLEKITTIMQAINACFDEQGDVLDKLAGLAGQAMSAADVEVVQKERSALDAAFAASEAKVKNTAAALPSGSSRAADKVKDLQERAKAVQARAVKQLVDKCDLLKKGVSGPEASKKLSQSAAALSEARKELTVAVDEAFAIY